MKGILYGVGVGPGDPELITLKAKRILDQTEVIAVPRSPGETSSTALRIAEAIVRNKTILELSFPMAKDAEKLGIAWDEAASAIQNQLECGRDIAFITLGDPTVYSTFMYISKTIRKKGYVVEIIPGVTSFCAAAAKAGVSLSEGSETLAVVPGTVEMEDMDGVLKSFDNVVVMKASARWEEIITKLDERKLLDKAVVAANCGMEDEFIRRGINKDRTKPGYFTTLIIKKSGVE